MRFGREKKKIKIIRALLRKIYDFFLPQCMVKTASLTLFLSNSGLFHRI